MNELGIIGKWLVTAGLLLTACGGLLMLGSRFFHSGRLLPGDVFFQKGNFTFFFPIVTCLAVSVAVTLILQFTRWWRR